MANGQVAPIPAVREPRSNREVRPNGDIGRAISGRPLPDPTADLWTLSVLAKESDRTLVELECDAGGFRSTIHSPADASPTSSRTPAQGSVTWIAIPSSQWTFTTYSLPVSRRTHSRCGLHTRAITVFRDLLSEGVIHFVSSMPAPVASGWSGCRVGLAPTGKRRLHSTHPFAVIWNAGALTRIDPAKGRRKLVWRTLHAYPDPNQTCLVQAAACVPSAQTASLHHPAPASSLDRRRAGRDRSRQQNRWGYTLMNGSRDRDARWCGGWQRGVVRIGS